MTGNHGEIKSGTNDGVVCIDSTFMTDYQGFQPKREHAYTYMQIVYLSLTYFKRADSFETNDTKIFLNT